MLGQRILVVYIQAGFYILLSEAIYKTLYILGSSIISSKSSIQSSSLLSSPSYSSISSLVQSVSSNAGSLNSPSILSIGTSRVYSFPFRIVTLSLNLYRRLVYTPLPFFMSYRRFFAPTKRRSITQNSAQAPVITSYLGRVSRRHINVTQQILFVASRAVYFVLMFLLKARSILSLSLPVQVTSSIHSSSYAFRLNELLRRIRRRSFRQQLRCLFARSILNYLSLRPNILTRPLASTAYYSRGSNTDESANYFSYSIIKAQFLYERAQKIRIYLSTTRLRRLMSTYLIAKHSRRYVSTI